MRKPTGRNTRTVLRNHSFIRDYMELFTTHGPDFEFIASELQYATGAGYVKKKAVELGLPVEPKYDIYDEIRDSYGWDRDSQTWS